MVLVRVITLLLVVVLMTGATGQVCASPDVASAVDDAPDLDTPVLPVPAAVPLPDHREPVRICTFRSLSCGRMHAVLVFRPPRLVASR